MAKIFPVVIKRTTGGPGTVGNVAWGPDFGESADNNTWTVGAALTNVSVELVTTDKIAAKDSWVHQVALCPTDTNHDGSPLSIEGTVATRKDAYIGWDVSSFPTGTTVTSATLSLTLNAAPLASQTIAVVTIFAAAEGWTEANVRCSNAPAQDTFQTSFPVLSTDAVNTVYNIALPADALTRLASRMGVGSFSLMFTNQLAVAGLILQFWDKDTGVGAQRPRLTFTATKTLL